jgi:hypothetical protein
MAEALSHIQEHRLLSSPCLPFCLILFLTLSLSLSLSEYVKSAPAEEIFEKSKVENFYKHMSRNSKIFTRKNKGQFT